MNGPERLRYARINRGMAVSLAQMGAAFGLRATRMTLSLNVLPRSHRGQLRGVNGTLPELV